MPFIETRRSFVNTWECDENDHLNVQFYFKNFAEAGEIFALKHQMDRIQGSRPKIRHVRYIRELRSASSILIKSAIISDGEYAGRIIHLLENSGAGVVSAATIDYCENAKSNMPTVSSKEVAFALPRGIPSEFLPEQDVEQKLARGEAIITNNCIIQPAQSNINDELLTQHYISCVSDGAAHIWTVIGVDDKYLQENNFGRVAMEMKLSVIKPAKVGSAVETVSYCHAMGEKTFTIRHQIRDVETGQVYATLQGINLIIDLEKRKAVPVPDFVRDRFN